MKNITISVDDVTYHSARVRAAEQKTSVSALVKKFLHEVVLEDSPFDKLVRQEAALRRRLKSRPETFRAGDRLTRDKTHARHALR
jgi:plasmid stability protein